MARKKLDQLKPIPYQEICDRLKYIGLNASLEENKRYVNHKIVIKDVKHPSHEFWFYPFAPIYWVAEEHTPKHHLRGTFLGMGRIDEVDDVGYAIVEFLMKRYIHEQPLFPIEELEKEAQKLKENLLDE